MRELAALLAEIGDAKRVRVAAQDGTAAERAFLLAWTRLAAGHDLSEVALDSAAAAVAGARLAGLDADVLASVGVEPLPALQRAFDEVAGPLPSAGVVRPHLGASPSLPATARPPDFAVLLCGQPRAGASAPGRGRVVFDAPESHGDHCWAVGVYAALLAPLHGADPGEAFALGLAHHLHNAVLPDAGFAGEVLLGDQLTLVMAAIEESVLETLPTPLADLLRLLLVQRADASTALARTFHAADVLDRVLQVQHHARAAAFSSARALEDLDLVHAGPVQAYQLGVLTEAGLW